MNATERHKSRHLLTTSFFLSLLSLHEIPIVSFTVLDLVSNGYAQICVPSGVLCRRLLLIQSIKLNTNDSKYVCVVCV